MTKMTIAVLRTSLIKKRENRVKWRDIQKQYPGVPMGTLCRIAKDPDYEPKSNRLRHALGLELISVEVVPLSCGHAPVAKRCPYCQQRSTTPNARRKRNKRLEAMRAAVALGRMLDGMTG